MCTKDPYRFANGVACVAVAALALGAANVYAETDPVLFLETRAAELSSVDLEEAFWVCDHTATTLGMDATPVSFCTAVYDELKARKFGGDFERLLGWWRQNKPAEHARRAAETERSQARLR